MKWLGNAPRRRKGITWGYPWKEGALEKNQLSCFQNIGGEPVQTKVMAYWPDGSVKWTGHAAVLGSDTELKFGNDEPAVVDSLAIEKFNGIYINNDVIRAYFPKKGEGSNLLDWIKINGQTKISDIQTFVQIDSKQVVARVDEVELEENGPVKAVIKVTASIKANGILGYQFIVRFKFYRNQSDIEMSHTFIVGDDRTIEGIALRYQTDISGEAWNRHVRFAGDDGIYSEPAQLLMSRRFCVNNQAYGLQVQGKIVELEQDDQPMLAHAKENAVWNNFNLSQTSSDQYQLSKQTDKKHTFIKIGTGNRSKGMVYVGGRDGGSALVLADFWQKYPASIQIANLSHQQVETTVWFWSPDGGSMDFRHYSKRDHMLSAYEGMEEIRSTPIGVSNSSRLTLAIFDTSPENDALWDFMLDAVETPLVVLKPEDYYHTKALGVWSLPTKVDKKKKFLEKQLSELFNFYQQEVEQRNWYGFWDYGDVMHTYDPYRHMWRYDLGGYAWQNTELVPNMWLWQYFLRTGDEKVFRMAEAMTKHTSEVDMYHLGEYQGLGSRHNVLHWGCQAKEVRVSMAGLHRYYYFLTGDERTKDILEEVSENQEAFNRLEPLREFYDSNEQTIPIRVGPDWASLVSNWFTKYEMTGEQQYLDHILTGIDSIQETPHRLLSGPTYHFNPVTKKMHYYGTGNVGGYHMVISFGAPQVWLELADNIKHHEWKEMLAEFGRFYALPEAEKETESDGLLSQRHFSWPMFATGMMGYAANFYQDQQLAEKVWEILLEPEKSGVPIPVEKTVQRSMNWKEITEMPWVSTNVVSQWCLNIMLCLELIGDYLPEKYNFMMEEEE